MTNNKLGLIDLVTIIVVCTKKTSTIEMCSHE